MPSFSPWTFVVVPLLGGTDVRTATIPRADAVLGAAAARFPGPVAPP
ncbi:hypothetical protein [Nonomuraea sp. NPDC001023]